VEGLVAPLTINTMPDSTLEAVDDHGTVGEALARDGDDALLARFGDAGVDTAALATTLQRDGAAAFVASWTDLLARIDDQLTGAEGTR